MNQVASLMVAITLFTVMLALGLSLRTEAMHHWRTRPALPLRVLLGSCLLVPLLALLVLRMPWSAALSPAARYGIALMALCPSAPLALRKAGNSGGDRQLAALLQISAALTAIVSVPLVGLIFRQSFQLQGWDLQPLDVALQVLRVQVLPLLLGLLLRLWQPALTARLQTPLNRLANLLLILLLIVVLIKAGPQLVHSLAGDLQALPVMVLLAAASLAIGAAMAAGNSCERNTTALVCAMRNPGLALYLTKMHGKGLTGVRLMILAYVLVTVIVSIPLVRRARQTQQA
ncbi:MAG: bile acid:sodium symporter [Synechococcaceae cyanobacterium]|nr:bile acid:sodium symporter [Synechococcaceae cyanobacterium]